jgi:hypothetical protein
LGITCSSSPLRKTSTGCTTTRNQPLKIRNQNGGSSKATVFILHFDFCSSPAGFPPSKISSAESIKIVPPKTKQGGKKNNAVPILFGTKIAA